MEFNISSLLISLVQDVNRKRSSQNREEIDSPSPQEVMEILFGKKDQVQINNNDNNWHVINETEDPDYPLMENGKFLFKLFLVQIITMTVSTESYDSKDQAHNYSNLLVKPEEIIIVVLVLLIWIGVILLFVRKWGKIRGLEPYTPSFDRNNSTTSAMMPLTSTSSQLGIPDQPPFSSFSRSHRDSKDTIKSLIESHHRVQLQPNAVFQFPPAPPHNMKSKITLAQTRQYYLSQQRKGSSATSEPDVRYTSVNRQNPRSNVKTNIQLHKPPHLKKNLNFSESQTSLE